MISDLILSKIVTFGLCALAVAADEDLGPRNLKDPPPRRPLQILKDGGNRAGSPPLEFVIDWAPNPVPPLLKEGIGESSIISWSGGGGGGGVGESPPDPGQRIFPK